MKVVVGVLAFVLVSAAYPQSDKVSVKESIHFFTGPPFSIDDILQMIGTIAEKRLAKAIERRGIAVPAAPPDYEKLRNAGAGPGLLKIIAAKAPPPPQTLPVLSSLSLGRLALKCGPPECDVMINGRPYGKTLNGALEVLDLKGEEAVVSFRKEGFEDQELKLLLAKTVTSPGAVTLKPTVAMRVQTGNQIFARMVEKFGGVRGLETAGFIAFGRATLWQSGGLRTDWNLTVGFKLPMQAILRITGAKQNWRVSLNGDLSKADGTKNMAGGSVALEVEKLVRLYRDYQPQMLIKRLRDMHVTAPLAAPQSSGEWDLLATGPAAEYRITVRPDGAPTRVVYVSPSGLGSGLEVLYADYGSVGEAWYPKSISFRFADEPQHGVELSFSSVTPVAKLVDKEFKQ